jgi:arylsulfatase A
LDGVSILPTLLNQPGRQAARELFYWEAAPQQALRLGDWKAYRAAPDRPLELYHLAEDLGEKHDLAAQRPEIAGKLERLMAESRVDSPDFPLVKKRKQ